MMRSLALAGLMAAALPAHAETPGALPPGMRAVEVLDGWATPDGRRIAALRIALAKGWKTYWRAPGDAGIPPVLNFAGSGNVAEVRLHWPAPVLFESNGMRSVGYHDELVLPVEIIPTDPALPIDLEAALDFGICHDVCIPVSVELSADIDGPGAPDAAIAAALSDQPAPVDVTANCTIEPIRDGMRVTATISLPDPGGEEVSLFEVISRPVWVSDSLNRREGPMLISSAEFVPPEAAPFALEPHDLRITVLGPQGALEIEGCADMGTPTATAAAE